jgi:hypothetical protein
MRREEFFLSFFFYIFSIMRNKVFVRVLKGEAVIVALAMFGHQRIDQFTTVVLFLVLMLGGFWSFKPSKLAIPKGGLSKNDIFEMSKNDFFVYLTVALRKAGWKAVNLTSNNEIMNVDLFGIDENNLKTLVVTCKTNFEDMTGGEEIRVAEELFSNYPQAERRIYVATASISQLAARYLAERGIECLDGEGLIDLFATKRLNTLACI